jgi:3-oxoacyl-[acyl-carrier protein] reductase
MMRRFAGKHVVITGAGGGLGRAFARAFAAEGAALILVDVDANALVEAGEQQRSQGIECATYRFDLSVEQDIDRFGAELSSKHSRIDVLVNNAGIAYGEITTGFVDLTQEKWLKYFAVNTIAPLLLARALRSLLTGGVVLNISSMASYMPATAYGITKAALNAMTYGMANAFAGNGVRVNAIAPGLMETAASKSELSRETYARIQGQQLLKLDGTAQDIASLALFLASDEARFITCEIVSCDAGNRVRGWRG